MRVAVTGANGFVGRAVVARLLAGGCRVKALTRGPDAGLAVPGVEAVATGPIESIADWRPLLDRTDAVVHLAARAHVPDARFGDEAVVRAINATATLRLAEAAARRGARRFVYVSSVKVLGEASAAGRPFRDEDPPAPADLYARSKAEAEAGLAEIAARTGLGLAILRPPLVYGPGVRANFLALVKLVARAPVLPFGAIDNRRSLASVDNLASAVRFVIEDAGAAGRSFLVSDGEDLSTPQLARLIAKALGRRVAMAPVPVPLLALAAKLAGREAALARLTQSLQVDARGLTELGWRPVDTPAEGVAKTVRWWRTQSGQSASSHV